MCEKRNVCPRVVARRVDTRSVFRAQMKTRDVRGSKIEIDRFDGFRQIWAVLMLVQRAPALLLHTDESEPVAQ